MKLFVIGSQSPVGRQLLALLREQKIDFKAPAEKHFDVIDPEKIAEQVAVYKPDQLINLLSFKVHSQQALFEAESAQKDCNYSNNILPASLAKICEGLKIPFIHISSYAVFDGNKKLGFNEEDEINPQGVYGKTLLKGELAVQAIEKYIVLRCGWLFGDNKSQSIKQWLDEIHKAQQDFTVPRRRFSPTPTADLARVILAISRQIDCDAKVWGVYHYCGLETKTESEFVEQSIKYASQFDDSYVELIDKTKLAKIDIEAPEISNSTLSCKKLFDTFGIKQKSWHGALQETIKSLVGDTSTKT